MRAGKIDKQKIFQNSQKQCETVELGLVVNAPKNSTFEAVSRLFLF